ncbi:hypothetical protein [Actinacidiphila rubida]|uniref:Uncharacterized protein n=1 Tax=Actinacidiphila rubida TaxID=310780 RepID=A0A1H8TGU4_9ACTN|nr:hypothetical protein SAMN05216267_10532 [Actinacidiphila rubida]
MGGVTQTHALHQLVPLAAELDDNKVTPGLLGFVIFAVMAVGLYMLMKNMGKQMKKIDFEEQKAPQAAAPREPSDAKPPQA